ncbi:hypothetical protein BDB00DRAFT_934507 [Zychaea mexicana]|uniref:uncharacterized protein n=1 Tax=Zychaea mexicana TaxID=64656 RepID=UPI0022FE681D|nr:uncharacterized protein BDB00DRAFT_934507 [Zychaea mexicana]KAI9468677.1 hypothetical protein BDB00DRAFT_934507 [Zychaea mexicana]
MASWGGSFGPSLVGLFAWAVLVFAWSVRLRCFWCFVWRLPPSSGDGVQWRVPGMAVAPPVCCMVMLGTLHCRLSVLEDEGDTLHSRNSWLLHWFTLAQKTPRGTPASTIPQSIVPQALPPHRPHSTVLGRPLECVYA